MNHEPISAQGPVDVNVSRIVELIESMERDAFEHWMSDEGEAPKAVEKKEGVYVLLQSQICWVAWKARAAHQRPCRGVSHRGCDYLAPCGSVCDKCGQRT